MWYIHWFPCIDDVDVFQLRLLIFHISGAKLVELRWIDDFLPQILLWARRIDDAVLFFIVDVADAVVLLFKLRFVNLLHQWEIIGIWLFETVEVPVLYLARALHVISWDNLKCILGELVASTLPLAQVDILILDSNFLFCYVVQISNLLIRLGGARRWWIWPSYRCILVDFSLLTFHWVLSLAQRIRSESLVQLLQNVLFQQVDFIRGLVGFQVAMLETLGIGEWAFRRIDGFIDSFALAVFRQSWFSHFSRNRGIQLDQLIILLDFADVIYLRPLKKAVLAIFVCLFVRVLQ